MDAFASRAAAHGIDALYPLYETLPTPARASALAMVAAFDPASVATTARFLASGAQPFESSSDLADLTMPVLLHCGDDRMHPAAVSNAYAAHIPRCETVPASVTDLSDAVASFAARCLADAHALGGRVVDA